MLMHWSISLGEDRSSCSVDEGGSKAGLRKEESPEVDSDGEECQGVFI